MQWLESPLIQWELLGYALRRFQEMGYVRTESPWIVDSLTSQLTHPATEPTYVTLGIPVVLVGSGEQSLLSMNLPQGSYVTCTPCFRPEPENELGPLKQRQFVKVELFLVPEQNADSQTLVASRNQMMHHAALVMSELGAERSKLEPVWTPDGEDLQYQGIELGSYSVRHVEGRTWICGTGLALPRFTEAVPGASLPVTPPEPLESSQKPHGETLSRVVPHPTLLGHDIPVETVLAMAAGAELESLVAVGFTKSGDEYFCASMSDGGECLWILARAQHKLLSVPETHFGEE